MRAANPHLAERTGLDRTPAPRIDEHHLAVRDGRADAAGPLPALRKRNHVRDRARLGHPVALTKADADAVHALLLQVGA